MRVSKPVSVWASAQSDARTQRRGRYVPDTTAHPARMLPAIAAHAIEHLTAPGEVVLDPMCGAGTTLVEALHLGRPAIGVEIEPRWAELARGNLELTREHGIECPGQVITADARRLPDALPPQVVEQLRGRVQLVLTSPPYGPSTHGQVRARPDHGVVKSDFRYSPRTRPANLAYQPLHRLIDGLSQILAGCLPLLAPGGHVAITARPWREHGELVDLPGAIEHAARAAGLRPLQRCAALLAGIRDDHLITRASFFQRGAVTKARATGHPWHLICHEDLLLYGHPRKRWSTTPRATRRPPQSSVVTRPAGG